MRASVSAELRAAWRLISRSVAAWRSRAASASRWASRQASRAAASADEAAFRAVSADSSACRLADGVDAGLLQFVLDIDEPRALGQPPRRAGRRMGCGDKTVPAPDVAFRRHQPLAGLQLRHQFGAALALPPRRSGRRRRASSAGASTWSASGSTPSGSAGSPSVTPALVQRIGADGIDRRVEVVAERGTNGLLITLGDRDAVDDRRPQVLGLAVDELGNRARFGFEPLHALVGLVQRRAGGFQRLARGGMRRLRWSAPRLRLRARLCCAVSIAIGERGDVAEPAGLLRELLLVALDVGDLLIEPRQPLAMGAHARLRAGCASR